MSLNLWIDSVKATKISAVELFTRERVALYIKMQLAEYNEVELFLKRSDLLKMRDSATKADSVRNNNGWIRLPESATLFGDFNTLLDWLAMLDVALDSAEANN